MNAALKGWLVVHWLAALDAPADAGAADAGAADAGAADAGAADAGAADAAETDGAGVAPDPHAAANAVTNPNAMDERTMSLVLNKAPPPCLSVTVWSSSRVCHAFL